MEYYSCQHQKRHLFESEGVREGLLSFLDFYLDGVTMQEVLRIGLGVLVFGLQHSGLSALRVKYAIIDRFGKSGYHSIFTATAILAFLFSFFMIGFWDWLYFILRPDAIHLPLFVSGIICGAMGFWLAHKASAVISVSTVADMRSDRTAELVTDGIYAHIRHPLYLATLLLFTGLGLMYPFLPVVAYVIFMSAYLIFGAFLEERKLIIYYGKEYQKYKEKAGFLLPRLGGNE